MGMSKERLQSNDYKEKARLKPEYYTRERKMGFISIIAMILNMMRKTSQIEIDNFVKIIAKQDGKENISYTKQAFSEARQKLSPKAFTMLTDDFVTEYYRDDDFGKYKGRRLMAIDGSVIEVPNNQEMWEAYGGIENNSPGLQLARAMVSGLYDLENDIMIAARIEKYGSSERCLAKANIEKMLSYGHDGVKNLILFDRGYPSLDLIMYLMGKGIDFLMRASKSFLREVIQTEDDDEVVKVVIDRERRRCLKDSGGWDIKVGTVIKIRVIKVCLDTGEEEILITNLASEELPYEEAKELYFRRWGIETKYDELKNKLEIENFSGIKQLTIEQDFYASIYISNMAALLRQDAQEELMEKNKEKTLKYEYKVNKSILFGKLKNDLILLILEEDAAKQGYMYDIFIKDLQRNVVPIRKNRHYPRKTVIQTNKYCNSRKRCL
jgi:hypothetical protein